MYNVNTSCDEARNTTRADETENGKKSTSIAGPYILPPPHQPSILQQTHPLPSSTAMRRSSVNISTAPSKVSLRKTYSAVKSISPKNLQYRQKYLSVKLTTPSKVSQGKPYSIVKSISR